MDNNIYTNKLILSSLDYSNKNILTYLENLKKVCKLFEYKDLRDNQKEAIFSLLKGEDLLFVSPTGGGKSFVYISTALSKGYKTIIFSPLISLIQNQSDILKAKGLNVGVISSAVTNREKCASLAAWEQGDLQFLFIAPERLQNNEFIDLMKRVPPDFIVVDEIHCAYEHSDNFRSSYKFIAPFIKEVNPKLFLGITATLSKDVEVAIRDIFDLKDTKKIVKAYKRENLHFKSIDISNQNPDILLLHILNTPPLTPAITYCSSVKLVEDTYKILHSSIIGGSMTYTGQMPSHAREANQIKFINGDIRCAFATNSFGMGIDKADIGKVIFRTFPGSLEELIQGFGRGGRNGCDCDCLLFGDFKSIDVQRFFIDFGFPDEYKIKLFYKALLTLKNSDDLVSSTLSSICNIANLDNRYASAIVEILKGQNVIKREDKTFIAKLRFLDIPKEDTKSKKFKEYFEKISYLGIEENDNFITIDLEFLASELDTDINCVKRNLKVFKDSNLIEYNPPAKVPPIKIISDLSKIDFQKLREKKIEKEQKLQEVIDFYRLNDEKKSDYLDLYFNKQNGK